MSGKGKLLVDGEKLCPKCDTVKPTTSFHKDKKGKMGHAHYCKECANRKTREYHKSKSSDETWVLKRRKDVSQKQKAAKLKAIEYLGGKCFDCGGSFPPYVYDFHHLDGETKLDNPSRFLRGSWDLAVAELDKCVLLCANCHRGRHFND